MPPVSSPAHQASDHGPSGGGPRHAGTDRDISGPQRRPFGLMTDALDTLRPGEVYVATGGSRNCAAWGEIMTTTARMRGAAGAIVDGFH